MPLLMKQLFIVRHAKSSWENPALNDEERPLLPKGIRRTKAVGDYLQNNNLKPEHIYASPAVRAWETTQILNTYFQLAPQNIEALSELYMASLAQLIAVIQQADDGVTRLMLVGHNPSFTDLVNTLSGGATLDWLVTSAVAVIDFEIAHWQDIGQKKGNVKNLITPKNITKLNE